ncbi:MAG: helix-hairpin-helix domain-containing protein, partial [Thermoleophilaceae bacterium]
SFDQLRGLGLSVTHATRVIAYRERRGGFDSVDDLHTVPGLPEAMLGELKEQLTA